MERDEIFSKVRDVLVESLAVDEDEVEARAYGAFVPIGQKLAFSHKLIRQLRDDVRTPEVGTLTEGEGGYVFAA